jgi:hypothetical protein
MRRIAKGGAVFSWTRSWPPGRVDVAAHFGEIPFGPIYFRNLWFDLPGQDSWHQKVLI